MSVPREATRGSGLTNPQLGSLSASTPALIRQLTAQSIVAPPERLPAQDKMKWAPEYGANIRQPKPVKGSPASQLKPPVRQLAAKAYGVKAASFGSTAPRFEVGEQSVTPGGRIHAKARRDSQATLSKLAERTEDPAQSVPDWAGSRKTSNKIGGELPLRCLEPSESIPEGGRYDPKLWGVAAQKPNAPKWRFDFQPVQQSRGKPEWKPELHGHGGPLHNEDKAWMSAISNKKRSSTMANRPAYSFAPTGFKKPDATGKYSYTSPSPVTMGGKKVPSDFGAGSHYEQRWLPSGLADAKQPDSRRPSSAVGSFGLSGSSRFGDDDPPIRHRPPSRASAATISGVTLDASPATPKATKPKQKAARPRSAWSGEERGCLEERGGAVGKDGSSSMAGGAPGGSRITSTPLRFGRNDVPTPAPGRYSHEGTSTGERLTLSTGKSSTRFSIKSRTSDSFQGTFDNFPGPGQYC
jgi:hypothetical protein